MARHVIRKHRATLKSCIAFPLLLFALHFSHPTFGQGTVQISGTVKSEQGAVQKAVIEFLNLNGEFQSSSISGPNGRFRSEKKWPAGSSVRIRVSSGNYKMLVKEIRVNATGEAGEFMLVNSKLIISGFVRDSVSSVALPGVEIAFYNKEDRLDTGKAKTSSKGYFEIETDFVSGQKITIRPFKEGYYDDKEYTQTFSSEGRTSLPDILLPELGSRGLRAFLQITNKKSHKPVGGAKVRFFDQKNVKYIDSIVPSTGMLELKLYQRPGTPLEMEISRPNYHTFRYKPTLSEDPQVNQFRIPMEKVNRSSAGQVLLIGAGAAALLSGGMFMASGKQYDSYKDFGNVNRESDLKGAEAKRTISAVSGGVAAAALIGYLVSRVQEKNQERAAERNRVRTSWLSNPPSKQLAGAGIPIVGLAYSF